MGKIFIGIIILVIAILFAFGVQFFLLKTTGKGALQITSNPKSNVYLNGKLIGQTPLCRCDPQTMIESGEYTIRIVPIGEQNILPFEKKITIQKSVLTAVDETFKEGTSSEGSVITLTPLKDSKQIELLVLSFPDKASVYLDSVLSGTTPVLLKNITSSDHEVKLTKTGYREKIVRIKTTPGYQLQSVVYLGINPDLPTPTSSPSASPTPQKQMARILETPTGFLRVRSDSSISSSEIARVNPGESYEILDEKDLWFEIKLTDGRVGWISSSYAQKQ